MKKLDAVNLSITSLYIFSSFMLSGLVSSFLTGILGKIVYIEFFPQAIISSALSLCVSVAILYCLVHRSSYRAADFSVPTEAVEMIIALAINCLIGILFGFPPITSGGIRNLAGIIRFGVRFDSLEMLTEIPLVAKLVAFLIYAVIFCLIAILAGKRGAERRARDRQTLDTQKKKTEQEESFGGFRL